MQYEDSFRTLRNDLRKRVERVPKRRWSTIAKPLLEAVNNAFEIVLCIEEDPIRGTKSAAQKRYDRIVLAQKMIKKIEKPLWVYWSICDDEEEYQLKEWKTSQRANLCEGFNKVLKYLHDMQLNSVKYDPGKDVGLTTMRYYTESEIEDAIFLRTIRNLHRMSHGKALRLNMIARDAEASLLLRFVDTAWYCAVYGNQMRLTDPVERERRKEAFSAAISSLNKMQRPLFNLFSIGSYSNREMQEWVHLLNESTRLLVAVQSSDGKRAG